MRRFQKAIFCVAKMAIPVCFGLTSCLLSYCEPALKYSAKRAEQAARNPYRLTTAWIDKTGLGSGDQASNLALGYWNGSILSADSFGNFYALESATGRRLWMRSSGNGNAKLGEQPRLHAGPHREGDMLWLSGENGVLTAFECLEQISEIVPTWSIALQGALLSSPRSTGQKLFIRTDDEKLYALDKKTGEQLWCVNLESLASGLYAIASSEQGVLSQEKESMLFLEHKATAAPTLISPTHLFVPLPDGNAAVLSTESGQLVGEILPLLQNLKNFDNLNKKDLLLYNAALFSKKHLFFSNANQTFCVYWDASATSLQVMWQSPYGSLEGLCLTDEALYLTTIDGELIALNRYDGRLLWRVVFPPTYRLQEPLVDEKLGLLFINDNQGHLSAFDLVTGERVLGEKISSVGLQGKPLIYEDNRIACLDTAGTIYAFTITPLSSKNIDEG